MLEFLVTILIIIIIFLTNDYNSKTKRIYVTPTLEDNFRGERTSDDTGYEIYSCEMNIKEAGDLFYITHWTSVSYDSFKSLEEAKKFNEHYFLKLTTSKREIVC